ncbi:Gfo/Idh/MocA family protein [Aureibacillus halotolerans]|uniref:Putative dehydrogenase n=1 Tax=Aureibacillus halotolerans TaxID=1508390 RepID=A0A4R6UBA6_9BACI|nr:Gfo/Idh/MocA family oxidoreductase [Aureibacillus halotolerans]TDQ42025.1 putative dehydrogenase [Aureibacillus halotolerans]
MENVRVGIIGLGNMGTNHAKYLYRKAIDGAVLTAISDHNEERLAWAEKQWGDSVQRFQDPQQLMASGVVDAVLIATPHYSHTELAIKAFENQLHVMVEKPAGVYTKQVKQMNAAAAKSNTVFGIMYNQRTNPIYQKLRDLVQSGELGEIKRTNWIITDWYRPQSYYDSGGWRATWEGEGGGVLLNQDPHQLDLWQWTTGLMPKRVRAFCGFGKYHSIEVEDDVTAYVEYENGATGVFVTSTGEAPGTNRYEISANNGKVVIENGKLTFHRLRTPEREFNATYKGGFGAPECWEINVPIRGNHSEHQGITQDWINAIRSGSPLLAPGEEGIRGLEISNAIHLSSWLDDWVDLPVDEDLYYKKLQEAIAASTSDKDRSASKTLDVKGTY